MRKVPSKLIGHSGNCPQGAGSASGSLCRCWCPRTSGMCLERAKTPPISPFAYWHVSCVAVLTQLVVEDHLKSLPSVVLPLPVQPRPLGSVAKVLRVVSAGRDAVAVEERYTAHLLAALFQCRAVPLATRPRKRRLGRSRAAGLVSHCDSSRFWPLGHQCVQVLRLLARSWFQLQIRVPSGPQRVSTPVRLPLTQVTSRCFFRSRSNGSRGHPTDSGRRG
jgi:hypothetical protein